MNEETVMDPAARERLVSRSNGPSSNRVFLRNTNPNLYRSLMTFALIFVFLGVNFLLGPPPTFQQYGISRYVIGTGFLTLGLTKLVFLNLRRNLRAVRILLIFGIAYPLFWGIGTTETAFAGTSSFQLFILYCGLAALQIPLLLEPFFNPVTANGEKEE
jgi:hypothetical protein